MGNVLEAQPEAGGIRINGEVPGDGTLLPESVIKAFIGRARRMKNGKAPAGHEIAVRIPDALSGVADSVPLEDLTLSRDPEKPGFFATYKKRGSTELEKHKVRDVTVALSVGAAITVASSLYWRYIKDK